MQIIHEGPVLAYVHGGDIVDYQVVCHCSKRELDHAFTCISERCGASDHESFDDDRDSFIAALAADVGCEHPLFDDPEKLMRGLL